MNVTRHSRDFLAEVMERPAIAELVQMTKAELRRNPMVCVVVGRKLSTVQVRVGGGKRTWVSLRALLWMDEIAPHTDLDPPTFATPSCGTAGCVNPAHQVAREEPQRIKVVQHVRAAE